MWVKQEGPSWETEFCSCCHGLLSHSSNNKNGLGPAGLRGTREADLFCPQGTKEAEVRTVKPQ